MKKFYEKSAVWFSLMWLFIYVILTSVTDSVSADIGMEKCLTAPFHLILSVILTAVIARLGIAGKTGFAKPSGSMTRYLFFIPLIAVSTVNFWCGVTGDNLPFPAVIFYCVSMVLAGFIEEVIFRGLLFGAMLKGCKPWIAVLVVSLTFGFGHIVNLIRGAQDTFETVLQIFYACALGFMFTILVYKGKSLIPGILSHAFIPDRHSIRCVAAYRIPRRSAGKRPVRVI